MSDELLAKLNQAKSKLYKNPADQYDVRKLRKVEGAFPGIMVENDLGEDYGSTVVDITSPYYRVLRGLVPLTPDVFEAFVPVGEDEREQQSLRKFNRYFDTVRSTLKKLPPHSLVSKGRWYINRQIEKIEGILRYNVVDPERKDFLERHLAKFKEQLKTATDYNPYGQAEDEDIDERSTDDSDNERDTDDSDNEQSYDDSDDEATQAIYEALTVLYYGRERMDIAFKSILRQRALWSKGKIARAIIDSGVEINFSTLTGNKEDADILFPYIWEAAIHNEIEKVPWSFFVYCYRKAFSTKRAINWSKVLNNRLIAPAELALIDKSIKSVSYDDNVNKLSAEYRVPITYNFYGLTRLDQSILREIVRKAGMPSIASSVQDKVLVLQAAFALASSGQLRNARVLEDSSFLNTYVKTGVELALSFYYETNCRLDSFFDYVFSLDSDDVDSEMDISPCSLEDLVPSIVRSKPESSKPKYRRNEDDYDDDYEDGDNDYDEGSLKPALEGSVPPAYDTLEELIADTPYGDDENNDIQKSSGQHDDIGESIAGPEDEDPMKDTTVFDYKLNKFVPYAYYVATHPGWPYSLLQQPPSRSGSSPIQGNRRSTSRSPTRPKSPRNPLAEDTQAELRRLSLLGKGATASGSIGSVYQPDRSQQKPKSHTGVKSLDQEPIRRSPTNPKSQPIGKTYSKKQ